MINSKEYDRLLLRKQELLREQETYIDNRNKARKHFAEIDFRHDLRCLEKMCENIYEKGDRGDRKLLNLLIESRELMKKQEIDIERLAEEVNQNYFTKERSCEDELYEVQRQLSMLGS